jgi:hypothetical protein
MLAGAAAFSLPSMVLVYLAVIVAVKFILRLKPSPMRLIVGFFVSWAAISFYMPFRSVAYYEQHSGEMYIAQLVIAAIALLTVTMLSPTRPPPTKEPGV